MRVGAFQFREPLPNLELSYAFAMLSPWIDVGRVGTSVLSFLEAHVGAEELGELARPGAFYDFTRYRPMLHRIEGRREVRIPNTTVRGAVRPGGPGLLFFHFLEPHMFGESWVQSVIKVIQALKVQRYCSVGSMYDSVPHTRPLKVSGASSNPGLQAELEKMRVRASGYQGPTSITAIMGDEINKLGTETMSLMVHLPIYAQLEEDYSGQVVLLELLSHFFGFSLDLEPLRRQALEQHDMVSQAVERDRQVREMVRAMEKSYDSAAEEPRSEPPSRLPPEIERFLRDMDRRSGPG